MSKISQVFIFCAGRGERMMPLTASTPKPLLEVKGFSILSRILDNLQKIPSIQKIFINSFYLSAEFEKFVKNQNNPKIILSKEYDKIETGGGLIFALDKIDLYKPLITLNGDVLWHDHNNFSDLNYLYENFLSSDCDFLLGLKKTTDFFGYDGNGDFNLIGNSLQRDFNFYGSNLSHVYVGMQVINPLILKNFAINNPHIKNFSVAEFYKRSVGKDLILNRINGLELKGKYFHIGTPQNLEFANSNF